MLSRPHLRIIFLAAVGVAVAACSESPTGPGSSTPDLSSLLAEMSPSSISSATAFAMSRVGQLSVVTPAFDPGQCTYTAATGFFACSTLTINGLTITRMYRLIDGAGNSQSALDSQTSAIETKMTVKGTPTSQSQLSIGGPFTIDGSSDLTLSGIRTDKHTLNGVSTTTLSGGFDFNGTSVPISSTLVQTMTNLVLPNAKAGQKWPQSGTMAFDETSNFLSTGLDTPETTHVVMTFNGTSVVTVNITDPFGTSTCHFDMSNPGVPGDSCS